MIQVQYENLTATFEDFEWSSEDKLFTQVLNTNIPEEARSVSAIFREKDGITGVDVIALEGLKFLGSKIKVLNYIPEEIPEEEPGVDV